MKRTVTATFDGEVLLPLMLAFTLVVPTGAQQKKSDLEHAGLLGKVKTVKVEEAKLSNKSGKPAEGKRVQLETQSYGENGMLAKSVRIDAGQRGDYFYSYDGNGSRLELIRSSVSSSHVKTEFKYDASGNRLEEVQTGDEGLVGKTVNVYDARGRCTERRLFNKQALFARRTYKYAADANPTEEAEYDPKGALVGKQSYSYELDTTGNWIKRITSTQGMSNGKPVTEPADATYRTITYY
jgi:YD repeat-containing protein